MSWFLPSSLRWEDIVNVAKYLGWGNSPSIENFVGAAVTPLITTKKFELAVGRHPLHELYVLAITKQKAIEETVLQSHLGKIPQSLYQDLTKKVNEIKKRPEQSKVSNIEPEALAEAIEKVVHERFERLNNTEKGDVYYKIWQLGGCPNIPDWGKDNAKQDPLRLLRAMYKAGYLDYRLTSITYNASFALGSKRFALGYPELDRGRIGFINGIMFTLQDAMDSAQKISTLCGGKNIHVVYSASDESRISDATCAILSQTGWPSKAACLLLEKWFEFFETAAPDDKYLEICTSRGAADVSNALKLLPEDLRKRMLVVAIAPAHIIPKNLAGRAYNLVIESDHIPQVAINKSLIISKSEEVILLPDHEETYAHNLHGSNYERILKILVDFYIKKHDFPNYSPIVGKSLYFTSLLLEKIDQVRKSSLTQQHKKEIDDLIDKLHKLWDECLVDFFVYDQAPAPKEGNEWGKLHRYDDLTRLQIAVQKAVESKLFS